MLKFLIRNTDRNDKTKEKYNTIYAGNHHPQPNTNNINKTCLTLTNNWKQRRTEHHFRLVIENYKNDLTIECMFCSVQIVVKISIKNIF
jgi:hypothetical protein